MKPKVLIVDDDSAWLQMMQEEMQGYSDAFSVITAHDGKQALEVLAAEQISLVVSDLRMPNMDGFELLNRILREYPDISVIIITAYDRPKTREVVFKSGAYDYMTKPFTAAELAEKINLSLKKKSEGGSLNNVSLETFLQLIEMEQQTCTLRVENKNGSKTGVLFFRDGELMNARIGSMLGMDAAYEILSWSGVSVSIDNRCPVTEKQLEGELQAILLDAMRTKDENDENFSPEEDLSNERRAEENAEYLTPAEDSETDEILLETPAKKEQSSKNQSPADTVLEKLNSSLVSENGVEDIYEDSAWNFLIEQASNMGASFEAGELNAIYINRGAKSQSVIVPGEKPAVILMKPDTPRDRIIDEVS
ncbi:MAG: response regulator [Desulfobacteraceae bacterium]|nr:response regulator [Desulfobacteraceae bacterium]